MNRFQRSVPVGNVREFTPEVTEAFIDPKRQKGSRTIAINARLSGLMLISIQKTTG